MTPITSGVSALPAENKRKSMESAISEMLKSKAEQRKQISPFVGAVLVSAQGKELGKAHRGQLREGDHAEYTLIERFLPSASLEGSTLYVTLEPCIYRPTKKPCAERITEARVGKVFIGMPDPNPKIHGKGIAYLLDHGIQVEFFDQDLQQRIRDENKAFSEQYSQLTETGEKALAKFEGPSEEEERLVPTADVTDFSHSVIKAYLKARKISFKIPSVTLWKFFHKLGFLEMKKGSKIFVPTVAGLLLFGKNPEDFLVQSKIKAEARSGGKIVSADITGPLLLLPDKIKKFFLSNMKTFTEIKDFRRIEVPQYPLDALREGVVNAIVHRDYRAGARVIIQIDEEKVIIKSPGLLLQPLSLDRVRTRNVTAYSRNPRIAETFSQMKLMEERGWGINRIFEILKAHALPPPRFDYDAGYFVVMIESQKPRETNGTISAEVLPELTQRQKKLLNFIRKKGSAVSEHYTKQFKISRDTANRDFKELIALGLIQKRGAGRTTSYVLRGPIIVR